MVEAQIFPTKVSPLCGWCPLVNLCPAAQASTFNTDRTEGQTALEATDLIEIDDSALAASCERGAAPTSEMTPQEPGTDTAEAREGIDMAEHQLAEGKPWEEDVAGTLNGASYAAIG